MLELSSGTNSTLSSGYASFGSLAAGLGSAPLPDQLLNSDYSDESLELNLGLDTEDERLGSDTEDLSLYDQPLMVRINRSRINLDQIVANRAARDELTRITDFSLESLSENELIIGTEEAEGSATETEDAGKATPKRSAQLLTVLRLPTDSRKRKRLNTSLRDRATEFACSRRHHSTVWKSDTRTTKNGNL